MEPRPCVVHRLLFFIHINDYRPNWPRQCVRNTYSVVSQLSLLLIFTTNKWNSGQGTHQLIQTGSRGTNQANVFHLLFQGTRIPLKVETYLLKCIKPLILTLENTTRMNATSLLQFSYFNITLYGSCLSSGPPFTS